MLKNKFSTLILLILFLANTIIFCTVANLVQVNDLLTEGSTSLSSSFENFKETSSSHSILQYAPLLCKALTCKLSDCEFN